MGKWISTTGWGVESVPGPVTCSTFSLPPPSLVFSPFIIKFIHMPHATCQISSRRELCSLLLVSQAPPRTFRFTCMFPFLFLFPFPFPFTFTFPCLSHSTRCQSYGEYSRCRRPKMYATFFTPTSRPRYVNWKSCRRLKNREKEKSPKKILTSPRSVFTRFPAIFPFHISAKLA